MSYEQIENQLEAWCKQKSVKLFKEFANRHVLFFYVTNKNSNCYQVWIEPPQYNCVKIHLSAVESSFNEELEIEWEVCLPRMIVKLDEIMLEVQSY